MNSYQLIGLTVSWMILVVGILCWGMIASKGHWLLKILTSLLVIALTLGIIYTWRELQGTPKIITLAQAENVIIRSYMIKEPKKNSSGHIWLWITTKTGPEPMSVEVPYTKKLHKQLTENKGFKEGHAQVLKKGKPKDLKKNGSKGDDNDSDYTLEDYNVNIDKESQDTPDPGEPQLDLVPIGKDGVKT